VPADCEIFEDRSRIAEAHAVTFHIPSLPSFSRIPKYRGQKWVGCSMESDVIYPMLRYPPYMARFDLTMTYRLDSDVPMVYFDDPELCQALARPPHIKSPSAACAYFASNDQDYGGRREYVQELMRYLAIDSYGRSLRNRELPEDRGRETKLATLGRYPFYLAFENSLTHDYVTEKFFDPLIVGCVPVYRGAPNIADFAPGERCFINAADFPGPRELAEHLLWLIRHPAEYEKYLDWKRHPLRRAFLEKIALTSPGPLTRLCTKLRSMDWVESVGLADERSLRTLKPG
jgi:hypothetical protein